MIKPREDVERFLNHFFPKFDIWGILFLDRDKNLEALRLLGITSVMRNEIIRSVETNDYVETIESTLYDYGDMWVFGKGFDGEEIYIKIALGVPGSHTICISFHKAEHKIQYAYRKGDSD